MEMDLLTWELSSCYDFTNSTLNSFGSGLGPQDFFMDGQSLNFVMVPQDQDLGPSTGFESYMLKFYFFNLSEFKVHQ